jgi:succinyl-diaminopimelate desuccinylase
MPERGCNPVHALPYVLLALRELSEAQPEDPVLGPATLTPTVIETWPKSGNVIPDRIRVTLDLRVLPEWDEDRALEQIRAQLARRVPALEGIRVEMLPGRAVFRAWTGWGEESSNFTPGFLTPDEHPVVQAAAEALRAATGVAPKIRPWKFGTDGGHTCGTHGIPTIGFAPGREALAHTTRERLELDSARRAFDAYPALIRAVQGALMATKGMPVQGLAISNPVVEPDPVRL